MFWNPRTTVGTSKDTESHELLSPNRSVIHPPALSRSTTNASQKRASFKPLPNEAAAASSPPPQPQPGVFAEDFITRDETPHDRAVSSLLGANTPVPTGTPGHTEDATAKDLPDAHSSSHTPVFNPPPSHPSQVAAAAAAAFPSGPEDIHDPTTGAFIGVMRNSPSTSGDDTNSTRQKSGDAESSNTAGGGGGGVTSGDQGGDNMWSNLSKIRMLQSDIARMHLSLDGAGIVDGIKERRATTGLRGFDAAKNQSASDLTPVPEDEFTKRKDNIVAIMAKVCQLSNLSMARSNLIKWYDFFF